MSRHRLQAIFEKHSCARLWQQITSHAQGSQHGNSCNRRLSASNSASCSATVALRDASSACPALRTVVSHSIMQAH
eukprot:12597-Heterococcus_DN1.PRE.2